MHKTKLNRKFLVLFAVIGAILFAVINANFWVISHAENLNSIDDESLYFCPFDIKGDTSKCMFDSVNDVLYISNMADLEIKNKTNDKTNTRICIREGAERVTLKLAGVQILPWDNSAIYIPDSCGNVRLFIKDNTYNYLGSRSFKSPAIEKNEGNASLEINAWHFGGEELPLGKLEISSASTGIGSGDEMPTNNICIAGGDIEVSGGNGRAAIGCGNNTYARNIKICGGNIKAYSSEHGAAIGGGEGSSAENIVISGGDITAESGYAAPAIGCGWDGCISDIKITDGKVFATGGRYAAAIGCGNYIQRKMVDNNIAISGGEVIAVGGFNGAGIGTGSANTGKNNIAISGGRINAKGGEYAPGIGGGVSDEASNSISISGGTVISSTTPFNSSVDDDNYDIEIGSGKFSKYGEGINNKIIITGGSVLTEKFSWQPVDDEGNTVYKLQVWNHNKKHVVTTDKFIEVNPYYKDAFDDQMLWIYKAGINNRMIGVYMWGDHLNNLEDVEEVWFKFNNGKWEESDKDSDVDADYWPTGYDRDCVHFSEIYKWNSLDFEQNIILDKCHHSKNKNITKDFGGDYRFDSKFGYNPDDNSTNAANDHYEIYNLSLEYCDENNGKNPNCLLVRYHTEIPDKDKAGVGFGFKIKCDYIANSELKTIYLTNNEIFSKDDKTGIRYYDASFYKDGDCGQTYELGKGFHKWYRDTRDSGGDRDYCSFNLNNKIDSWTTIAEFITSDIYRYLSPGEHTIQEALDDGLIRFQLVGIVATDE